MAIYFYSTRGPYGGFSNFSRHSIRVEDNLWKTSEHYFQAMKFAGTTHEDDVRRATSPGQAAAIGRDRLRPLREDWDAVKQEVMYAALVAKFTQHDDLKALLLGTGDEELLEQTTDDHEWGVGSSGTGKNLLGKLLMRVRDELRAGTRG